MTTPRPLIVRLRNWIGDVVLGIPALELLQAHGHDLQLVARGGWAPALLAGYGWPVHVQPADLRSKVRQLRSLRRQARTVDPGFDGRVNALVLPASLSSALEMRLAGLRAAGVAHEGRSPLLARVLPTPTDGHELQRYLSIAAALAGADATAPVRIGFRLPAGAAERAAGQRRAAGVDGGYVVVCPFAAGRAATPLGQDKKWPGFADFVAGAEPVLQRPIVIYPGPGEADVVRRVYPAARLLQGGDLGTYAAVLQGADLVVANDTGPGHLAAAVGVPVVSVLGAAPAARWAPYGATVTVVQRPVPADGHVDWPQADEVLESARERLSAAARAPAPELAPSARRALRPAP